MSGGAHGFIGRRAPRQYRLRFRCSALPTNDSVGLVGLRGKNTENSNKSLFMFLIDLFVGSEAVISVLVTDNQGLREG